MKPEAEIEGLDADALRILPGVEKAVEREPTVYLDDRIERLENIN